MTNGPSDRKYYTIGTVFAVLICVTVLTAFFGSIFRRFSALTLVIYSVVVIWEIVYEKALPVKIAIFLIMSSMYFLTISFINYNAGIGSSLLIIVSMLCMTAMNRMAVKKKLLVYLENFSLFAVLAMTAVSFYIHSNVANYMTFSERGVNPNSWAEITIFLAMLYTTLHVKGNKLESLLIILCATLTAFNCRTRFMTVGVLCFAVLYLFPIEAFKDGRIQILAISVIVIGTLFPLVYLLIYNSGFRMMIYGKDFFTGREVIWNSILNSMRGNLFNILFGVGSNFSEEVTNTHSVYMGILADFGVIGYFIYFGFIVYMISLKGKEIKYENTKNALLMFIVGNLLIGITETSMLWSGIFCLCYIGLGIADPINYNTHSYRLKGNVLFELKGVRMHL